MCSECGLCGDEYSEDCTGFVQQRKRVPSRLGKAHACIEIALLQHS
jgi:hypothetical protein